jgi:hypothetical protein
MKYVRHLMWMMLLFRRKQTRADCSFSAMDDHEPESPDYHNHDPPSSYWEPPYDPLDDVGWGGSVEQIAKDLVNVGELTDVKELDKWLCDHDYGVAQRLCYVENWALFNYMCSLSGVNTCEFFYYAKVMDDAETSFRRMVQKRQAMMTLLKGMTDPKTHDI